MTCNVVTRDAAKIGNQRAGALEVRNIPDDRNEPRSDLRADAKNLLQLTALMITHHHVLKVAVELLDTCIERADLLNHMCQGFDDRLGKNLCPVIDELLHLIQVAAADLNLDSPFLDQAFKTDNRLGSLSNQLAPDSLYGHDALFIECLRPN